MIPRPLSDDARAFDATSAVSAFDRWSAVLVALLAAPLALAPPVGWQWLLPGIIVILASLLGLAVSGYIRLPVWARVLIAMGVLFLVWRARIFGVQRAGFFFVALCQFVMFSVSPGRRGQGPRVTAAFVCVLSVLTLLPPVIAVGIGAFAVLGLAGGLIHLWSGLGFWRSLGWFAKRSIRKETLFIIALIAGIVAVGLRRAQDYASRQMNVSGLSSVISPGSISKLSLSHAVAMRVRFSEEPNFNPEHAYFRGTTMDRFLGFEWASGPTRLRAMEPAARGDVAYAVALSPRYSDFLPVLDYGLSISSVKVSSLTTAGRDNGVFFPVERNDSWSLYNAVSRVDGNLPFAGDDQVRLTQMTKRVDPRVIALGQELAPKNKSAVEFIQSLKRYLTSLPVRYSLEPGADSRKLEDFLFVGRQGYCEHYASASAALARVAGIPARVVGGFLGGTWSAAARTLFVRDLDAHAWTEMWDEPTRRWIRFDPVAVIAPDRINGGAEAWLRSVGAPLPDEASMAQNLWMATMLMEFDNFLAALNVSTGWQVAEAALDYGPELAFIGISGLFVSWVLVVLRKRRAIRPLTSEERVMRELEGVLTRKGIPRQPGETVASWLGRCALAMPDSSEAIINLMRTHTAVFYEPAARRLSPRELVEAVGGLLRELNYRR